MVQGRIIAVTGAFGVVGAAVAALAASRGARVALIDYATQVPADLGPESLALPGVDLTDAVATEAAMQAVKARFGGLDALLNVAGGFHWETIEACSVERWTQMHRLNVVTAVTACCAALPLLRASTGGRIVNVGSAAALKSGAGMGAYTASKAGVHRLTESLADELKGDGVTVNAVLPLILDTPTNRADMPDADFTAWATPTDVAEVMLFLASPEARGVTGALVPITGKG